jgi:hypothetical protein
VSISGADVEYSQEITPYEISTAVYFFFFRFAPA